MYDRTEETEYTCKIEAPAEISILDTYREICQEAHPVVNSAAGRQKLSESIKNRLYENIRAAFGIDMATQSPVDIYPVFTLEPWDPGVCRVDFVVAPRRVGHIRLKEDFKSDELRARDEDAEARRDRLEEARENANEAASKWEGQCKILEQRMDAIIKLLPKIDIGCELCSNACDANVRDCVECRVDCKCRYCNSPDGHSNWQFVGWDKVLQEDDHEKSNNCAAWDAAGPQILPDPKRLDDGKASRSL